MKNQLILKIASFAACLTLLLCGAVAHALEFDAEKLYESVVVVYSGNALGSGAVVQSGVVITNAHVLESKKSISVATYSGKRMKAKLLALSEELDLATLAIEDKDLPALPLGDDGALKVGDDVYAVGAPESLSYTLTKGILSAKERKLGSMSYLQTDAPINSGNSGGPLLNTNGEIVGINTLKITQAEGIGLAIPSTRVKSFLDGSDAQSAQDTSESCFSLFGGSGEDGVARLLAERMYLLLVIAALLLINIVLVVLVIVFRRKIRRLETFEIEIQNE